MEFTFSTEYNQKALTAMARTLRKTVRRKRSRRSHILGWIIVILGAILTLPSINEFQIGFREVITWLAMLSIVIALLFEDWLNGYIAGKRLLAGTDKAASVFTQEHFTSETAVGKSEFAYSAIQAIAETEAYFVFIFSTSHAQVYDKSTLQGGNAEQFRLLLEEKTEKKIIAL